MAQAALQLLAITAAVAALLVLAVLAVRSVSVLSTGLLTVPVAQAVLVVHLQKTLV